MNHTTKILLRRFEESIRKVERAELAQPYNWDEAEGLKQSAQRAQRDLEEEIERLEQIERTLPHGPANR